MIDQGIVSPLIEALTEQNARKVRARRLARAVAHLAEPESAKATAERRKARRAQRQARKRNRRR